jgi:hypothetical protein
MAAAGAALELQTNGIRAAAHQLQAAVRRMSAAVEDADGEALGDALIQIRETGIDPLEAVFAAGVPLPNLALLCRPHHRILHEEGWSLDRRKDGSWVAVPPRKTPASARSA